MRSHRHERDGRQSGAHQRLSERLLARPNAAWYNRIVKSGYLSEIFVSFQGEGAHVGRRHLFVRLSGCNLRCRYCDTPDSLERTAGYTVYREAGKEAGKNPVSAVDLAALVTILLAEDAPIDAIAITGGEPLTQSEFLADFLRTGRFSVPVLLETNGVLPRRLPDVLPFIDIISMDVKPPSNTGEGIFWEEHAAFLDLSRNRDTYVKLLVDEATNDQDIERAAALVGTIRPAVPVFMQPIVEESGAPAISPKRLTHLYRIARPQLDTLRVLPQTHKLLGIR
jgi:7-carboxy-7-deazaguanine synthase